VRIELSGGIGNQLFQYSFGKFLARGNEIELTFVVAPTGSRETSHKSKLKDFHFGDKVEISNRSQIAGLFSRIDRYLSYHVCKYNVLVKWCFQSYTQTGVGFDENILKPQRFRRVRGYFQSYLYPESIRSELISEFELVAPSEAFLSFASEAKVVRPIVVHVRRGDYAQLSTSVGILGVDYYFNGIKALSNSNLHKQVWIFSDDDKSSFSLATQLEELGLKDFRIGFELTDSETLKLLSLGSGIVIANSTFSWWAAFLGNYENNVVAPQEWYKGLPDPKELIPKEWKVIDSSWE
jgi:hypothetical protein